jgi:putative heme-binding domain-containing protein
MGPRVERAFALARETRLPQLTDSIHWYAASLEGAPLNLEVARLAQTTGDAVRRRLAGIELAMKSRANIPMPPAWKDVSPSFYAHPDPRVVRQAERLAAVFGDNSKFPRLRTQLANAQAAPESRQHAFAVLSRAQDRESLPIFIGLLGDKAFRVPAIALLARLESAEAAPALINAYESFGTTDRAAALNALTGRASYAQALLDAVAEGKIKRDQLTSFHVRQLTQLKNPEIDRRVAAVWGRLQQTPGEKVSLIQRLEHTYDEAPLWAFSAAEGRKHFQKLCLSCHRLQGEGVLLGPDLTGAGRNGARYFLENIIDPNAVIGTDFQMTTIETKQGDVLTGLLTLETPSAVTLRTPTGESVVAKTDITTRTTSDKSLMPEGLLEPLNQREQIELLKFLTSN